MHRWLADEAFRLAAPPGDLVLDVAGGTGLASRGIRNGQAVVLDLSLAMLAAARSAGAAHVVRGEAQQLPFSDSTFDLVMCVSALPYIADAPAAAREWHRVCKPSGRAVVTAWMEDGLTLPLHLRQAAAAEGIVVADPNSAFGTESRLARLLTAAGFTVVDVQRRRYVETHSNPQLTWAAAIAYGFAPALVTAPAGIRDRIRQRFLASLDANPKSQFTTLIALARR